MNLQLDRKTTFISGPTTGIGFVVAKVFLQEGAQVTINGRTPRGVQQAIPTL